MRVTGLVRRFNRKDGGAAFGYGCSESLYAHYAGQPLMIAAEISPAATTNDVDGGLGN